MTSRIIHDHSGTGAFKGGFSATCGCMTAVLLMGFMLVGGCGMLLHIANQPPPTPQKPPDNQLLPGR